MGPAEQYRVESREPYSEDMDYWQPIGGFNFMEDRLTLPAGYTVAPAYAQGMAQLLEGEADSLAQLAEIIKSSAGKLSLMRMVCEAQGGTAAESRIRFQLIYGTPGSVDYVEYAGAREELIAQPRFLGETLVEFARRKAGL